MSKVKQQFPKGSEGAASIQDNEQSFNEGAKREIAPKQFNFDDAVYNEIAEKYKVQQNEKDYFHVIQEVRAFDNITGKRLSSPEIQIYENKEFPLIESALKRQGWTFAIIHNPNEQGLLESERGNE